MSSPPPRQTLDPNLQIACHRHDSAYVSVVLSGSYEEAGEHGRRLLAPGDVAVHGLFSCHRNSVSTQGAIVLNLPTRAVAGAFGQIADIDAVARLAETDTLAAATQVRRQMTLLDAQTLDWPDELAAALGADPQISLGDWAQARGLASETVSRGFRRAFGVSPKRFRFEVKMRNALGGAIGAQAPLAQVALDAGFADQAQMNRALSSVTGISPGEWRRRSSGDNTGV